MTQIFLSRHGKNIVLACKAVFRPIVPMVLHKSSLRG